MLRSRQWNLKRAIETTSREKTSLLGLSLSLFYVLTVCVIGWS